MRRLHPLSEDAAPATDDIGCIPPGGAYLFSPPARYIDESRARWPWRLATAWAFGRFESCLTSHQIARMASETRRRGGRQAGVKRQTLLSFSPSRVPHPSRVRPSSIDQTLFHGSDPLGSPHAPRMRPVASRNAVCADSFARLGAGDARFAPTTPCLTPILARVGAHGRRTRTRDGWGNREGSQKRLPLNARLSTSTHARLST